MRAVVATCCAREGGTSRKARGAWEEMCRESTRAAATGLAARGGFYPPYAEGIGRRSFSFSQPRAMR